jgi:rod shape-determining protein MreD
VLIALGFLLLVAQAVLSTLAPIHAISPNLLLPVVIYLGVDHDVALPRGAAISFVLGYLLDAFCGSPMGLATFVMVATFLVARGAGLRLFLRGPLFQIGLTFVVGMLSGGAILALRAIFERPPPFPVDDVGMTVAALAAPAFVTAILSPFMFAIVRRIDRIAVRTREEGVVA